MKTKTTHIVLLLAAIVSVAGLLIADPTPAPRIPPQLVMLTAPLTPESFTKLTEAVAKTVALPTGKTAEDIKSVTISSNRVSITLSP